MTALRDMMIEAETIFLLARLTGYPPPVRPEFLSRFWQLQARRCRPAADDAVLARVVALDLGAKFWRRLASQGVRS